MLRISSVKSTKPPYNIIGYIIAINRENYWWFFEKNENDESGVKGVSEQYCLYRLYTLVSKNITTLEGAIEFLMNKYNKKIEGGNK